MDKTVAREYVNTLHCHASNIWTVYIVTDYKLSKELSNYSSILLADCVTNFS